MRYFAPIGAFLSERSGAVSDNSSSNGLLRESSAHLSHNSLALQEGDAKINKMKYCLTILMLHKPCEGRLFGGVREVE